MLANVSRRLIFGALALSIPWVSPAAALSDQSLQTEAISSGSSPVKIDACRAALVDKPGPGGVLVSALTTKRNYYIAAAIDFTNVSAQTVDGVRVVFDVLDTFNAVTQTFGFDQLGTYSPGIQIHAHRTLAGAVTGATEEQNTAGAISQVICKIEYARFTDGRIWHYGDRNTPAGPGLYYPPTPSPTPGP